MVVLFHRVDDRLKGNPIACTAADFRRYCAFFRAHFDVIPVGELVRRLRAGEDVGGCLAITFDDGYRDNVDVAAPILQLYGLPACFFIATGLIGTNIRMHWDHEFGVPSAWMQWDQVRALRARGFEIGAHTVSHVDLGMVEGVAAHEEIRGSRRRLEEELGESITLFSYPYGGPNRMTDANRAAVREAGLECCMSAYGGWVDPDTDILDVKRVAVSPWYKSPEQFGFELLFSTP